MSSCISKTTLQAVLFALLAVSTPLLAVQQGRTTRQIVADCDRLAASPYDPERKAKGVETKDMDAAAAIEACRQAVRLDATTPRLQYQYGRSLTTSRLLPMDAGYEESEEQNREGAKWYRKAAEQGYPPAQHNLGDMYFDAQGVRKNNREAVKWYRMAANQGIVDAQYKLGLMLHHGQGLPQDYRAGALWMERAAVRGHAKALNDLGTFYNTGAGVPRDYRKALVYYGRSAQQGYGKAQLNIGGLFYNGFGVPQDSVQAAYWFTMASQSDDPVAAREGRSWRAKLKEFASLRRRNDSHDVLAGLILFAIALALTADHGDGGAAAAPGLPAWKPYDPCSGYGAILPVCGGPG